VRVVFASRNAHKTEQVRLLLPRIELVTVDDVAPGIVLAEPFDTFPSRTTRCRKREPWSRRRGYRL
jgi:hypothetical protein